MTDLSVNFTALDLPTLIDAMQFALVFTGPDAVTDTSAHFSFSYNSLAYSLDMQGSGLAVTPGYDFSAGTISAFQLFQDATEVAAATSDDGIDAAVLGAATAADFNSSDIFAFENLVGGLNIFYAAGVAENFANGSSFVGLDSWPLNLTGGNFWSFTPENDNVVLGSGNDTVFSGGGSDVINGGAGDDLIIGEGTDTLIGGAGDDTFGVDGADTVAFSGRSVDYTITSDGSSDIHVTDGRHGGPDGADHITGGIGTLLQFSDGTFTVAQLTTTGVVINGTAGDDTIVGQQTVAGQPKVTNFNDTIFGGTGDDHINGGKGQDEMHGGKGSDTYTVDNAGDRVIEDGGGAVQGSADTVVASVDYTLGNFLENLTLAGTAYYGEGNSLANKINGNDSANLLMGDGGLDIINGKGGADIIHGGEGNDKLNGGEGADQLFGDAGNDHMDGGTGADTLAGGAGNDSYYVDDTNDVIQETDSLGNDTGGKDQVFASVNDYVLSANLETLTIVAGFHGGIGNDQNNFIYGNSGNDILYGEGGNDVIHGGDGGDQLVGGEGNDKLDGGTGYDILWGGDGSDTFTGGLDGHDDFLIVHFATGKDRITDFQHGIDLLRDPFGTFGLTQGAGLDGNSLDADYFVVGKHATAEHAQFVYDDTTRTLHFDSNGIAAGGDQQLLSLQVGAVLTASDFYFDI